METLAYVYSAVAYEDAPAQELVSSSDDELVFEGINWKKFSSRACLYLLPIAVAFGSSGITSQAQARTSDYRSIATSSAPSTQWDTAVDVNSLVAPEAKTAQSVDFKQVGYYYQPVGYRSCHRPRKHYRHSCYRPRRSCYKRCYYKPVVYYKKVCYRHRPVYHGCYRPKYHYKSCYKRRHYHGCYRRRHYHVKRHKVRYHHKSCYRPKYRSCYRPRKVSCHH